MNCLNCKKHGLLESLESKRYSFKLFPFSSTLKCSNCDTKHNLIFLLCTPKKISYVITKRISPIYESYI